MLTIEQRALEIARFLAKPYEFCLARLKQGFGYLHGQVAQDWRNANPKTDDEILEWYRNTEAYIWELSAYHLDPGFNYEGMLTGVSESLRAKGVQMVLCLGDGIGDLTLRLAMDGFVPTYHDLAASQTAFFALNRLIDNTEWRDLDIWGIPVNKRQRHGRRFSYTVAHSLTSGWEPDGAFTHAPFDAVVSLDFLEHVTHVEAWVRAIYAALRPGGWLMAQNAFACGSGENGSMPMHLARNDRFEKDWDPLLLAVGFRQESSNWYQKPL